MAHSIETHYDILKVMRNAPVDVIKASYRVMSQKYHPDRNRDPGALDLMQRINQAWDVLRDPERRATHDRWIATQESKLAAPPPAAHAAEPAPPHAARPRRKRPARGAAVWVNKYGVVLAAVAAVAAAIYLLVAHFARPVEDVDFDAPVADQAAADGEQAVWYTKAWEAVPAKRLPHGYFEGEVQYYADGLSSVEIDNTAGATDADVRLYRNGRAVRSMFVHQGKRFVAEKLPAGTYSMKYKLAVDGKMHAYQANDVYQLTQTSGDGVPDTATTIGIKLSEVKGGTHEIPLDQI